jgi:hypothetical protein
MPHAAAPTDDRNRSSVESAIFNPSPSAPSRRHAALVEAQLADRVRREQIDLTLDLES